MNALNYHWCKTSLLPQVALKHVVSRDFVFKNAVHGTAKNEEIYGIVSYLILSISFYVTFKSFNMWVTSGLLSGSGQVGQQM